MWSTEGSTINHLGGAGEDFRGQFIFEDPPNVFFPETLLNEFEMPSDQGYPPSLKKSFPELSECREVSKKLNLMHRVN